MLTALLKYWNSIEFAKKTSYYCTRTETKIVGTYIVGEQQNNFVYRQLFKNDKTQSTS